MERRFSDLNCDFEIKSEDDGDDVATFTGIATTSDIDLQGDIIEAGAFDPIPTKLSPDGIKIPNVMMLRDHERSEVIGGWKSFKQNGKQLLVEGELALEVAKARETYALMKRGYLSGISVGYSAKMEDIKWEPKTGRRYIKKGLLKECSIVSFPANTNAKIISVKSELDDWLMDHGCDPDDLEKLLHLVREATPQKPYGDVAYADPGYQEDGKKRYPIDTEGHIRAAWNYINKTKNRAPYTRDQLSKIEGRIIAAWKRVIDKEGPPAAADKQDDYEGLIRGIDGFHALDSEALETEAAREALTGLLSQLKRGDP